MLDKIAKPMYSAHMDAAAIRRLRAHMNVNQNEFAILVGASRVSISNWERGVLKPDKAHQILLQQLADQTYGPLIVENGKDR